MNANYRVFAKALIVAEHPAPQVSGAGLRNLALIIHG
jgi:hypothetical protein